MIPSFDPAAIGLADFDAAGEPLALRARRSAGAGTLALGQGRRLAFTGLQAAGSGKGGAVALREFRLRLTRKGKTLYEELIPRLQRKEREIMSCLSDQERKTFDRLVGKIEASLGLIRTSEEADAKDAY